MRTILKKPILGLLLVVLAAGVGAWRWQSRGEHRALLSTAVVKRGELSVTISATGTLEPIEVVDVGAQVAGLIQSFGNDKSGKTIDYRSEIEEGTILARIDDSVYAADLALARAQLEQDKAGELSALANLEQMQAKLVQAEADWKRAQELIRSKLLAQSDFDSYVAAYQVAKANLSVGEASLAQAKAATVQAQAMLDKAQRNLDFCVIKSPVKGVIIDRRVNIGQTVVASLNAPSLFLIAKDLTRMQIWASVNEADVGRIIPGTDVTFTCDAFPGREFKGTVAKVRLNATMTQNVVMYTVEVNTENSDNVLLPYLTANVHFVVKREPNALLIPNAALRWSPSSLSQVAIAARSWKPTEANPDKVSKERIGVVWMKEGEFVRPVEVAVGSSDGANTAVNTDKLAEGAEVVTGEVTESDQAAVQNPFIPQIRRR